MTQAQDDAMHEIGVIAELMRLIGASDEDKVPTTSIEYLAERLETAWSIASGLLQVPGEEAETARE